MHFKGRNIYVIFVTFYRVSYTLVCVVPVMHTVRNFLFKNRSKCRQGILPVFLGVLLRVFVSLYVALQDKEIDRERERESEITCSCKL